MLHYLPNLYTFANSLHYLQDISDHTPLCPSNIWAHVLQLPIVHVLAPPWIDSRCSLQNIYLVSCWPNTSRKLLVGCIMWDLPNLIFSCYLLQISDHRCGHRFAILHLKSLQDLNYILTLPKENLPRCLPNFQPQEVMYHANVLQRKLIFHICLASCNELL